MLQIKETFWNNIFPKDFTQIKSLKELKEKYTITKWKNKWNLNWNFKSIIEKFEKINMYNPEWLDWIEYLYKLYFIKKISIRDCIYEIKKFIPNINLESKQLSNIMKKNLWWTIRWRTEKTLSKLKKDQEKKTNSKNTNVNIIVNEILNKVQQKPLNYKIIDAVKEKRKKVMYFLNDVWILENKTKENFKNFLNKYLKEKNISYKTLAKILNEVIYKTKPPYDFKINAWNISNWKKL